MDFTSSRRQNCLNHSKGSKTQELTISQRFLLLFLRGKKKVLVRIVLTQCFQVYTHLGYTPGKYPVAEGFAYECVGA